ncbi:hypothetical protein BJX70DRAFT_403642 [Aspergillus crustosus]
MATMPPLPQTLSILAILLITLTLFSLTNAQIGYDAQTTHFVCPSPNAHYCAAGSLQGSSLISCTAGGDVEVWSCRVVLSHILPPGYEDVAICYESSKDAGDAVCAFNGTGYTFTNLEILIPETKLCEDASPQNLTENHNNDNNQGEDMTLNDLTKGVGFPRGERGTEILSSPSSLSTKQQEEGSESHIICSNPWAISDPGMGMGKGKGNVLTLDIVLVVPTTSTETGTGAGTTLRSAQPLSLLSAPTPPLGIPSNSYSTSTPGLTPPSSPRPSSTALRSGSPTSSRNENGSGAVETSFVSSSGTGISSGGEVGLFTFTFTFAAIVVVLMYFVCYIVLF